MIRKRPAVAKPINVVVVHLRQHFLYFLPEPQGHVSLRPIFTSPFIVFVTENQFLGCAASSD